jgi:hypothetical protein
MPGTVCGEAISYKPILAAKGIDELILGDCDLAGEAQGPLYIVVGNLDHQLVFGLAPEVSAGIHGCEGGEGWSTPRAGP